VSSRLKKILQNVFFLLLAAALVYWAFSGNVDTESVWTEIKSSKFEWIGVAVLIMLLSHWARALRWVLLLEAMGKKVPTKHSFFAVMSGYLINSVTPRMGELARCALLKKTDDIPIEKSLGTVVTERVFDLLTTLIVLLIAIMVQYELIQDLLESQLKNAQFPPWLIPAVLVIGILSFLLFVRIFNRHKEKYTEHKVLGKIIAFLDGLIEGAKSISKLKKPGLFLVLTALIWVFYLLVGWMLFYALPSTELLGAKAALTTLLLGVLAVIIPTPSGAGTLHVLIPAGLALYGIDKSDGVAYATLSHGLQTVVFILVGGISIFLSSRISKQKKNEAPESHIA
jgi:uncharacterized protein (TIRG00374 family)